MTLQVGDKVVTIPLRDGGRVTVRSGTLSVGDKAVLIPGANGQIYAVRPASPQVGDKVILYPLRNGGHVCLASADDEGGSSPSVMPPGNFNVRRTGPSTADLKWLPGEGNTAVRIVRRPDRYPTHINDGSVAYEGAGDKTTDTGLDYRLPYYYCAWGRAGSKYSNGYLMDWVGAYGIGSGRLVWINDAGSDYSASGFSTFAGHIGGDTLERTHFSQIDLSKYRTIYFMISALSSRAFLNSDDASRVREWYDMGGRIFLTCEDRDFAQADFNRIGEIVGVSISGFQYVSDRCITSPSSSDLLQGVKTIFGATSEGVLAGGTPVWSGRIHRGTRWVADGSFTRFYDSYPSCDRSVYWSNIQSYLG